MTGRAPFYSGFVAACCAAAVLFLSAERLPGATVQDRVATFGAAADARWSPHFKAAGLRYPPARVTLVGLKQERRLEVYAAAATGSYRFVRSLPILAASGQAGPKLREGDGQVPEGLYRIELLNPNSRYHLSLRVSYPNDFDRARGREDGRRQLGGDIMIHGSAVSIGCLAMGDEAAEDLFILAARTAIQNINVLLAPVDFRRQQFSAPAGTPPWTEGLYASIRKELAKYPAGHPAR